MVVAQRQPDNMTDGDGIVSVFIRDDRRFFKDTAHPQDGHLRLQNDRRTELRSVDTRVGNGNRAALYVIWLELLAACALTQIGDRTLHADKAQVLRTFHYRHNQSPLQRHGNADVHTLVVLNAVIDHGRVNDRLGAYAMHQCLGDKRHERKLYAVLAFPAFADFFTQLHNARHVDFEHGVHVRAGAARLHHAIGNLPAHRRHGHELTRQFRKLLRRRRNLLLLWWSLVCGLLLLLLWRSLRSSLRRRSHWLRLSCSTRPMLLDKALDVLLADPAAETCSRDAAQINIVLARDLAYQR